MFKLLVHFISTDMLPSSRLESSKYFPFVVEAKESTCSSGYVSAKKIVQHWSCIFQARPVVNKIKSALISVLSAKKRLFLVYEIGKESDLIFIRETVCQLPQIELSRNTH
jgi:hypothetical protein